MNTVQNAHGKKHGSDLQGAKDHGPQYASTPDVGEVTIAGRQIGDLAAHIRARGDLPTMDENRRVLELLTDIRDKPGRNVTDALVALSFGMQMLAPLLIDLPQHDDDLSDDPLLAIRLGIDLLIKSRETLENLTGVNSASITGHFRPN